MYIYIYVYMYIHILMSIFIYLYAQSWGMLSTVVGCSEAEEIMYVYIFIIVLLYSNIDCKSFCLVRLLFV